MRQYKAIHTSFLVSVLGITILFGGMVFSVSGASIEDQIDNRQDELKDIKAKIKAYKDIINLKQRQGVTLSDQIESLEAQAAKLELEISQTEKHLSGIEKELGDVEASVSEKERYIEREKEVLSDLIREYHAGLSDGTDIALVSIGSGSVLPMQREDWLSDTGERIGAMLRSLGETRAALVANRETLAAKKKEADDLKNQLEQRSDYLEGSKSSKETLLAKTAAEQQRYTTLVKSLEEEQKDIEDEINNLQSGEVASLDLEDMPKGQKGLLSYPVTKVTITQGYGMTSYAKKGAYGGGPHNGIDFGVKTGTPIYAAKSGKVVGVGSMTKNGRWYGYGRWIAIDHGNGMVTLYGHLSKQSVKKGDKVNTGEQIGLSGNTGYSSGPHLHFSVFSAGSYKVVPSSKVSGVSIPIGAHVNPTKYLP